MLLNPFAKDILKFDTFYNLCCTTPLPSFTPQLLQTLLPATPPKKKKGRKVLAYKFWLRLARPLNTLGVFYLLVDLTIFYFLLLKLKKQQCFIVCTKEIVKRECGE